MGHRTKVAVAVCAVALAAAAQAPATSASAASVPATAAAPSAVATAASADDMHCETRVSYAAPDGTLGFASTGYDPPSAGYFTIPFSRDRHGVTALADVTSSFTSALEHRRGLAVRDGVLWLDVAKYPRNQSSAEARTTSIRLGSGWSRVTRLVDVSTTEANNFRKNGSLYGLVPSTGELVRYRITEPSFEQFRVVRTGTQGGYDRVRTLALAFVLKRNSGIVADVLIATTSAGRLYLVEVPRTAEFRPRVVLLRASGWNVDDLAVSQCDDDRSHQTIITVDHETQRARMFHLGRVDLTRAGGTSSTIAYRGAIKGSWPFRAISSEVYWGFYQERWARTGYVFP